MCGCVLWCECVVCVVIGDGCGCGKCGRDGVVVGVVMDDVFVV